MILKLFTLLIFFLSIFNTADSQTPDTDIYIADYKLVNGELLLGKLHNITNREGYDNQPYFHPENKWLYFSSIRNDGQSDIYRYEWEVNKIFKVTNTFEDEFSPQKIPGKNSFSTVRVEFNQKQRLWAFNILNPETPELLFPEIERVGYSAWIDANNVALFIVAKDEKSHELLIVKNQGELTEKVDSMIGRGLAIRPNTKELLYVSQSDSGNWNLKLYDSQDNSIKSLAKALDKSEDYCWLNSNLIISGKGITLFGLDLNKTQKEWTSILNLGEELGGTIERIAIHPVHKRIALVINKEK